MKISLIVAMGKNRAIGKDNKLLWHLKSDLRHFVKVTKGHPVIMGRKTFESLNGPLPKRTNIVITRNQDYQKEGIVVCHSLNEAYDFCRKEKLGDVMVIGGQNIYEQALEDAQTLHVTRVDCELEADTFFPLFEHLAFRCVSSEPHQKDEENEYDFVIETWERF